MHTIENAATSLSTTIGREICLGGSVDYHRLCLVESLFAAESLCSAHGSRFRGQGMERVCQSLFLAYQRHRWHCTIGKAEASQGQEPNIGDEGRMLNAQGLHQPKSESNTVLLQPRPGPQHSDSRKRLLNLSWRAPLVGARLCQRPFSFCCKVVGVTMISTQTTTCKVFFGHVGAVGVWLKARVLTPFALTFGRSHSLKCSPVLQLWLWPARWALRAPSM